MALPRAVLYFIESLTFSANMQTHPAGQSFPVKNEFYGRVPENRTNGPQ
jgi:hypothetical protein